MRRVRFAALLLLSCAGQAPARGQPTPAASAAHASVSHVERRIADAKQAMLADPKDGLDRAREAARIAGALPPSGRRTLLLATTSWLEGEALMRLNDPAAAAPILAGALGDVERTAPGTQLHGDLLQTDGFVSALLGKVPKALQDYQRAYTIYRGIGDARGQAGALMNIGSIYKDAGDYEKVLTYYAQAAEVFKGDPKYDVSMHNNRGNALSKLGRAREAEAEYRLALAAAQQLDSPVLVARILNNLALAQEAGGQLAAADATADRGMQIARASGASEWLPFFWVVKAKLAFRRGDLHTAAQWIGRTFADVDLATTPMTYREFHDFAHTLYARLGEDQLALAHLEAFKRLDDESRAVAASTNAALMAAQFDFANQNLRIANLKTGQLERDVLLAKSRARMHRILTYGLGGTGFLIVALLSFGFFKIRRANHRLSMSNTRLEKALKAKTEFLATTSHEIRTPLNGILGMTQVILHDPAVAGPLRERLQVVQGAGETMKVLVDDILDVAKMETGNIVIDRAEMDLRQLLTDVVRLWSGQARGKALDLELETVEVPRRIVEDETRLRQILFNLLSNAIKFTDAGSVRLIVDVVSDGADERLRFRVVDTGIGIPADHHAQIFEAFHQVDGGTTRRHGGTGLGLAICRNLSVAMGGTIAVESAPGAGSTFTVTLPLARAAAVEDVDAGPKPCSLAGASLLLVERNPLAQSILRATLENEVASYHVVDGGEAALDFLRREAVDIIVAEGASATMPQRDGFASVAAIAVAAPGAHLAVLWTGLTEEDRVKLEACGAARVLAKPIAARAVLDALRGLVAEGCEPAEKTRSDLHRMSAA